MDEKKKAKSLNKKLFIALIIVCAILGTAFAIKSIASTVYEAYKREVPDTGWDIEKSVSGSDLAESYYWDGDDLDEYWWLVCCADGQPLGNNHKDGIAKDGTFAVKTAVENSWVIDAEEKYDTETGAFWSKDTLTNYR